MTHLIQVTDTLADPIAPNVVLPAGRLGYRLVDGAGQGLPGVAVQLHVLYGGARLRMPHPSLSFTVEQAMVELTTDASGNISSPEIVVGPDEEPFALLVQTRFAHLEHRLLARYGNVDFKVVSPAQGDRKLLAGTSFECRVSARDSRHDLPIPGLPIDFEIVAGGATMRVSGVPANWNVRRTGGNGETAVTVDLSRRTETVEVRAMGYWLRNLTHSITVEARSPRLHELSHLSIPRFHPVEVIEPFRFRASDSEDDVFASPDAPVKGLFAALETEDDQVIDVHPPVAGVWSRTKSFQLLALPGTGGATTTTGRTPTGGGTTTGGRTSAGGTTGTPLRRTASTGGATATLPPRTHVATPTPGGTTTPRPHRPAPTTTGGTSAPPPQPEPYTVSLRLPDYPDTDPLEAQGDVVDPHRGSVPTVSAPANDAYVRTIGGGNEDEYHHLTARLTEGALQYVGPNANSERIRVEVDILPPAGKRRLIEARFKVKVRTTPMNSSIDDPANTEQTPGKVAKYPGTTGTHDELELAVTASSGTHHLDFFFHANALNLDHVIDITAEVTMEDEDPNDPNLLVTEVEDSTIQLRAGVLQPRLLFVQRDGADFVPVKEAGIRTFTPQDRSGNPTGPPADAVYYLELRAHSGLASPVACELSCGATVPVDLTRRNIESWGSVFRSDPISVALLDSDSGGPPVVSPAGAHWLRGSPNAMVEAVIASGMDKNTDDIEYATGARPITAATLVEAGDPIDRGRVPASLIDVDVRDDGTWAAVAGPIGPQVEITGTVHDPHADLSGPPPGLVRIGGTDYPLSMGTETASFGRPAAWVGSFAHRVDAVWGLQAIEVAVTNALGVTTTVQYAVDIQEENNNRIAPVDITATVRRIGGAPRRPLPHIVWAHTTGTWLGEGQTLPQSITGRLATIAPFPQGTTHSATSLALHHRSSEANVYASAPWLLIREDLAVPNTVQPNAGQVLELPVGGRVELNVAVPNQGGPVPLVSRREQPAFVTRLVRQDDNGQWVPTEYLHAGDVIRVEATATPEPNPQGGAAPQPIDAYVAFVDPDRRPAAGDGRRLWVRLHHTQDGDYELASWMSGGGNFEACSAIRLTSRADDPIAQGQVRLGVAGNGRIIAGDQLGTGHTEVDLPAMVAPRRRQFGAAPLPREHAQGPVHRVGYLGSVAADSGELILGAVDREFACRGFPIEFVRSYHSGSRYVGPLGTAWNPNWNRMLWRPDPDTVGVFTGDGAAVFFTRGSAGWRPEPGVFSALSEHAGWWQMRHPGGGLTTFLPLGDGPHHVWLAQGDDDAHGNASRLVVPEHGRQAALIDPLRRPYQLTWDADRGRVAAVADFAGRDVLYAYHDGTEGLEDDLASVQGPAVAHEWQGATTRRTLSYTSHLDPAKEGLLATVQDSRGHSESLPNLLAIDYQPTSGHVLTQTVDNTSFILQMNGDVLTITDRRGNPSRVEFDGPTGGATTRLPARTVAIVSGDELIDSFQYNAEGAITEHLHPLGNKEVSEYDDQNSDYCARGQLVVRRRLADDNRSRSIWSTRGQVDPAALATENDEDELVEETTSHADHQLPLTATDAYGRVSTWVYDGPRLIRLELPDVDVPNIGTQTRHKHYLSNNWGQLLEETNENGVMTRYWYFPESDPTGRRASKPVSAVDQPGGFLARIEVDATGGSVPRDGLIQPARTLQTDLACDEYGFVVDEQIGTAGATAMERNALGETLWAEGPGGGVTTYKRDANGNVTEERVEVSDLYPPAHVNAQGTRWERTTHKYDREGRRVSSTLHAGGPDLTTSWVHDANGNVVSERSALANATGQPEADPHRTDYEYDENDRMRVERRGPGGTSPFIQTFDYDANGNVVLIAHPTGVSVTCDYDAFGRQWRKTDGEGTVVESHYDRVGNLVRQTVTGSVDGRDTTRADLLSDVRHVYDEADRRIMSVEPAFYHLPSGLDWNTVQAGQLRVDRYWYDPVGQLLKIEDEAGLVSETRYDGHGKVWKESRGALSGATYHYDTANNRFRAILVDGLGTHVVTQTFDDAGRPLTTSTVRGLEQRVAYDTLGRPRFKEDALGNTIVRHYDRAGRLDRETRLLYADGRRLAPGSAMNPQIGYRTTWREYDLNGNLLEARDGGNDVVAEWTWHPSGRVHTQTGPNSGTVTHHWGEDGRLERLEEGDGLTIHFGYDNVLRRTEARVDPVPVGYQGTTTSRWRWDGAGRVVAAIEEEAGKTSEVQRSYWSTGALRSERSSSDIDGADHFALVSGRFDPLGRPAGVNYPHSGPRVKSEPDEAGLVHRVEDQDTGFEYATYTYHGTHPSERKYGNGYRYGFGYDSSRRVQEIRTYTGDDFDDDDKLEEGSRMGYLPNGMIEKEVDLKEDDKPYSLFAYDSLYQMVSSTHGIVAGGQPASGRWTDYDIKGNVDTIESGNVTGTGATGGWALDLTYTADDDYDTQNRLVSRKIEESLTQTGLINTINLSPTYDERGNLITLGDHQFIYDYRNRLVAVKEGSQTIRRLRYDGFDRRYSADDVRFSWFGGALLAEKHAQDDWFKRYIRGTNGTVLAYETDFRGNDERFFVHSDSSGTAKYLSNDEPRVIEYYQANALGKWDVLGPDKDPKPADKITGFGLRMHGHHYDPLGLHFTNRARVQSTWVGRFLQPDPKGVLHDNWHGGNAYKYGNDNSKNFVEDGHAAVTLTGIIVWSLIFAAVETAVVYAMWDPEAQGDRSGWSWAGFFLKAFVFNVITMSLMPAKGSASRIARTLLLRWLISSTAEWGAEQALGFDTSWWQIAVGNAAGEVAGLALQRWVAPRVSKAISWLRRGSKVSQMAKLQQRLAKGALLGRVARQQLAEMTAGEVAERAMKRDFFVGLAGESISEAEAKRRIMALAKKLNIENDVVFSVTANGFKIDESGGVRIGGTEIPGKGGARIGGTIHMNPAQFTTPSLAYPMPEVTLAHEAAHLLYGAVDDKGLEFASVVAYREFFLKRRILTPMQAKLLWISGGLGGQVHPRMLL